MPGGRSEGPTARSPAPEAPAGEGGASRGAKPLWARAKPAAGHRGIEITGQFEDLRQIHRGGVSTKALGSAVGDF